MDQTLPRLPIVQPARTREGERRVVARLSRVESETNEPENRMVKYGKANQRHSRASESNLRPLKNRNVTDGRGTIASESRQEL